MLKSAFALSVPLLFAFSTSVAAAPNVVASIKPIHSLVAGVMNGVATPELLVQGGGSPHGYSLRPSQAGALENADIVFWVGEGLETFLAGSLSNLAADVQSVELLEIDGITLLEPREGGLFEEHEHFEEGHDDHDHEAHEDEDHEEDEDHDHDEEGHDHEYGDAHIWLDPENARVMLSAIADTLSAADPENAQTYGANSAAMIARIDDLETDINAQLDPIRGKPFFVFHDAYQYFEERFDIEAVGSFTVNPEIAPGAGRLSEIQAVVANEGAVCIFAEPQFSPRVIETVAQGTGAQIGTLDPLGADIADGPDLYFTLLETMAGNLADCLAD